MKKSLLFLLFLSFTQVFFAQQNNTVFQYGNGYFGNPGSGNSLINLHPGSHFGITNITLTNITIPAGNNPITATAVLETTTGIRDSIAGTIIARENTSPTTAFFFQPNVGLSKTFAVPGVHTLNLVNSGTLTTTIIPAPTGSNSGTYTFSAIAVVKIGSTLTVAAGGSLSGNLGQIASELTSYQSTTPSIFTNTATSVTNTTAIWGGSSTAGSVTASGVIYSNIATQAAFTGNTANSGSSIQSMTYSGANAVFSATNSSLQPSTTYYYRAYVTVGGNVYQGILKSFTTCPTPVITGTQGICIGSTSSLSVNPTGGTWSSSNSSIATVNASGVVTGVSSGNATITYNYTGTGCTSSATIVITVTAPPSAGTLSGTQAICSNGSTTLSSTVSGGSWTSSNTAVATINSGSGVVSGIAAGTSTMTYTVLGTGGCANATATRDVTVTSAPNAGTVSGTQNICVGGSTTFTTTGTGGSWSSSNTNVATVNPSTGEITGVAAGTATITYTVTGTGGCTDATAIRTVSVTAAPSAGTLSGTTSICSSGSTTLSSTVSGGTWSSGTTGVATVNSSTGVVSGVSAGTATITYTVSGTGGCSNATATTDVTVSAGPNAGTISGTQNMCEGSSFTFTTTGIGGNWSAVDPNVADVAANGSVNAVTAGTTDITYTVLGSGGCLDDVATFSVTVSAAPTAGTLSGTTSICSSGSTTLSSTVNGGTWSSGITSVATVNSSTGVVTGVSAGTTTLTYTVTGTGGCSNATETIDISVSPAPSAGIISGSASICLGSNTTYSSSVAGGTWSSSNTSVATVNSSSGAITSVAAGTSTITYTVAATATCPSASATKDITVSPALTAGTISGNGLICPGTTQLSLTGATSGATITWASSATQNGTYNSLSGSGSPYTTPSLSSATYFKATVSNAGCGSVATSSFLVDVVIGNLNTANSVGAVTGPTTVTPGTTGLSYSVVPMAGAVTYVWALPAGLAATTSSNNGANILVDVASTYQGGSIEVYAEGCLTTQSLPTVIEVNTPGAVPFTISCSLGTNVICGGTNGVVFSVPTMIGATYLWSLPAGVTLVSGSLASTSITVNFANNYLGSSIGCARNFGNSQQNESYRVGGLPQPNVIFGESIICGSTNLQYSIPEVAGASSYVWSLPSGLSGSSTTNVINVVVTSSQIEGFISVRALNSNPTCGSSPIRQFRVRTLALPAGLTGPTSICGAVVYTIVGNNITTSQQNTFTYSVTNNVDLEYTWTVPIGMQIINGTQGSNSITVSVDYNSFVPGFVEVFATDNESLCSSGVSRIFVNWTNATISGPSDLCGLSTASYSVPNDAGSSFEWSVPSWMTILNGQNTNSISVSFPTSGSSPDPITVTIGSNCGGVEVTKNVGCNLFSRIVDEQCGQSVPVNNLLTAISVAGATEYKFKITALGFTTLEVISNTRRLPWSQITGYTLGTTYSVEVAVRIGNQPFGGYGSLCFVTPLPPNTPVSLVSCSGIVSTSVRVLALSLGQNQSKFRITGPGVNGFEIIPSGRGFFWSQIPGYVLGSQYAVEVSLSFGSSGFGAYGAPCYITPSSGSNLVLQGPQEYLSEEIGFVDEEPIATIENAEPEVSSWDALAYSNPFETAFKLSLMNAEGIQDNEQLAVVLSDLNGKVYSSTSLTKRELESADFGANVASGLYIVTVQYSNESRTLRVLKK